MFENTAQIDLQGRITLPKYALWISTGHLINSSKFSVLILSYKQSLSLSV
nr:hypothetical protein [Candidatus Parabeggiatoa sp.]